MCLVPCLPDWSLLTIRFFHNPNKVTDIRQRGGTAATTAGGVSQLNTRFIFSSIIKILEMICFPLIFEQGPLVRQRQWRCKMEVFAIVMVAYFRFELQILLQILDSEF